MNKLLLTTLLVLLGFASLYCQSELVDVKSVDVGLMNAVPFGRYADLVSYGVGVHSEVNMGLTRGGKDSLLDRIIMSPGMAITYEIPKVDSISLLMDLLWQIQGGIELELAEGQIIFNPAIAYGGIMHLVQDDDVGSGIYYDSVLGLSLNFTMGLSEKWGVYLSPSYQLFLEEENLGHQILVPAGLRVYL